MNMELMEKILGEWMREDTGYYYTFKKNFTYFCRSGWGIAIRETPVSELNPFEFRIETEGGVDYLYIKNTRFVLNTLSENEIIITTPSGEKRRFVPAPYNYETWPRPTGKAKQM